MLNISPEVGRQVEFNLELTKALSGVAASPDLSAACAEFAQFLTKLDAKLLSVKFCDINDQTNILRPYSAYHQAMQQFRTSPIYPDGCPFSREALKRMRPFCLSSIDRSQYRGLNDRRFFKELDKTGHKNIAIIPVMVGSGLSLITVGLGEASIDGSVRHLVSDATSHFVAAFVSRFPDVSKLFETKVLTDVQQKTVLLACEGLADNEIAERLGLSSMAVRLIFDSAAKRLGTTNRAATAYRAVILGEIPSGSQAVASLLLQKDVEN